MPGCLDGTQGSGQMGDSKPQPKLIVQRPNSPARRRGCPPKASGKRMIAALYPLPSSASRPWSCRCRRRWPVRLADDAPTVIWWCLATPCGASPASSCGAWRWPEVWRLNREQIRNPHLIYPGQVIVPTARRHPEAGQPRRRLAGPSLTKSVSLQVYSDPGGAIQSIPVRAIMPFLSEPLVVMTRDDATAGIVVATQEGCVFTARADLRHRIPIRRQRLERLSQSAPEASRSPAKSSE